MNPTPTQVARPWRAALRTGLQAFLSVAGIAALALPLVSEFVAEFWPGSPVIAFIAAAAAFIAALSILVTRVMAIAAVDALLTRIGIGASK